MSEQRPDAEPLPDELLGAYAVDAVDPDEHASVEAYLATHAEARAELARFEDVLAALADTHVAEPPEDLWNRLQQRLRPPAELRRLDAELRLDPEAGGVGIGPPLRLVSDPPGHVVPTPAPDASSPIGTRPAAPKVSRVGRFWRPALLAVAAAIAAVALSVAVIGDRDGPGSLRELALAAEAAPGARAAVLQGSAGTARLVLDGEGNGYLLAEQLQRLDESQTYQLWSLDGETPVSLGVLGAEPTVVALPQPGGVAFALSVEFRGGSAAPTLPPVAVGELST